MKKNILIIGRYSFFSVNLFHYFKSRTNVKKISFSNFRKLKSKQIDKYHYIINCSLKSQYIKNKYNQKNDLDLYIANKIKKNNTKLVFLGSRHVYYPRDNIKENYKKNPISNYGKNKSKTENLINKVLGDKVLILRIANIIGDRNLKNYRKIHKTFIDIFFETINLNYVLNNQRLYKDFLTIGQIVRIIYKLIKIDSTGIFNVSSGKKIFLFKLIEWLLKYNKSKINIINPTKLQKNKIENKSFYLNNSKLRKKINFIFKQDELKKECFKLSKKYLYGKK